MRSEALDSRQEPARTGWLSIGEPRRPFWSDALHILAVFNVLLAHPLLERASDNVWFFVAERASSWDIIIFALLLCLVAPGVLVGIEGIAELINPRLRNALHGFLMLAILSLGGFVILLMREGRAIDPAMLDVAVLPLAVASLAIGIAVAVLYLRFQALQLFATFLAVGILVVPGNFLLRSGASKLVFPDESSSDVAVEMSTDTPVVMVVFDELPLVSLLDENQEIDAERFPGFASLAGDSHWFRNATGISDASNYAIPAMLSGVYPEIGNLPTYYDYPRNLFTMLGDSYDMRVVEPVSSLCPDQTCGDTSPGTHDQLALWGGAIVDPNVPRPILSPDRPDIFADFTASIEEPERPTLFFQHSMMPHSPWVYLPSGKTYTGNLVPIGLQADHTWAEDDWLTTQNEQRHLLQLVYTDRLLDDLMTRLQETGVYDDALIVVTADHGISFRPGEHSRFISEENVEYITPVPLIIKQPGQDEGEVHDREVELIDLLPTIADVLEIDLDWDLDGQSLFDESRPAERDRVVFDYSTGSRIVLDPTTDRIEAAAEEKARLFDAGDGVDGLYRVGRYADLIGQEVEQLPVVGESEMEVSINGESRYEEVDLEGESIPAFVTGDVRANAEPQPTHLAVAVNGTVRAVTRTYFVYDDVKFAAMAPEESFRQGENQIDILHVSGATEDPEIRRIER